MRTSKFTEDFFPDTQFHFHLYNSDFPEWHDHDYWEFFIILSGEITQNSENILTPQILSEGMGCLVHPWDRHKFVSNAHNYQQLNLAVTDENFKCLLDTVSPTLYDSLLSIPHPIVYEVNEAALREIIQSIHIMQTNTLIEKNQYIEILKLIWFIVIKIIYENNLNTDQNYPAWLNDFIAKSKTPENIAKPVSKLNSLTYYSYSSLARLFKQYTGEKLVDYHTDLRINYGAVLLRTTDMNILSISSAIGYDSLSHFIHIFKKHFHLTPRQYRESFSK